MPTLPPLTGVYDAVAVLLGSRQADDANDHQPTVRDHARNHLLVGCVGISTRACDPARDAMAGLVADRELHAALGHLVDCFDPGRVERVGLRRLAALRI